MRNRNHITHRLKRFIRCEDGVQLTEFAILLPILLLLFAVTIEGARMMWSYQATNAAVRDASRYLARVVPSSVCTSGGSIDGYSNKLTEIVRENSSGSDLFPNSITIDSVTLSLNCYSGGYRQSSVPVVQVTANLTITFPFQGVFQLVGSDLATITTSVTDQHRAFGT